MNYEEDKHKLKSLQHLEHTYVGWFEGGGGEVHRIYDEFILYSVPQYGGVPRFEGAYFGNSGIDDLLKEVYSWT